MYVKKGNHTVNTDNFDNINLDEAHNSVGFHRINKERFILSFQEPQAANEAYELILAAIEKGKNTIDLSKIL